MAKLTDFLIRKAKPAERITKLYDGNGLYLWITPSGGKLWRFKYTFGGKEKSLSLGGYPLLGVKAAREKADDARRLMAEGRDPSAEKQARKRSAQGLGVGSLEMVAREWFAIRAKGWAASHGERVIRRLERDVFPYLGARPIHEIDPPEVLVVLRRIEQRGAIETARRAKQSLQQIMAYAVATGQRVFNPVRDLGDALIKPQPQHMSATTTPEGVAAMLRMLDGYQGSPIVRAALKLGPLTFVRPGELRSARWEDIDLEAGTWCFVLSKVAREHIVPLSTQAVAILRDLYPLTGAGGFVFPSARSNKRPMSDNAVLAAMRRCGIDKAEMTGHGWRAVARTLLDEALGVPPHLIEHQLGHDVRDALGRAYNRTQHLPERREMMQRWANYLDDLREGIANVIPIRSRGQV